MGKKWNWSEAQKAAHSKRMKEAWKSKRMSEGQRKGWDGAEDRRNAARRRMVAAWDMSKAKVLVKLGKFKIIWG
jgi:hypothetical protein